MQANRCANLVAAGMFVGVLHIGLAVAEAQGVRGFGVEPGKLPFRSFGNPLGEEALRTQFPEAAAAISGDDRSLARSQISRTDANGDGIVNEKEWADSGYQTPQRFAIYDLNGDGKLTLYEHSIGIARWRRRTEQRSDARQSAQAAAAKQRSAPPRMSAVLPEAPQVDPRVAARREQVAGLADYLFQQYDVNEDSVIERAEFRNRSSRFGEIAGADKDRNGKIDREEIGNWLGSHLPPLSRLNLELQERDLDRDDQVTFREFESVGGQASIVEFNRWDRNRDGFITPYESYLPSNAPHQYENATALVIKPSASVVSEMWIKDELRIDRLQVHVRVTKEGDNFTSIHLVSPSGQRVALFAGGGWRPWRGGLILNGVNFSDTAPLIKEPLNAPPYPKQLRPSGKGTQDDPNLSSLRGQSTQGAWRLVVRNQDENVGLLIQWSMIVTPLRGK